MKKLRCLLFIAGTLSAFPLAAQQQLAIRFHAVIGKMPLVPGQAYVSALGDTIAINRFLFYVSHLSFVKKDGNYFIPPAGYYLIDAFDSAAMDIRITVPDPAIRQISFLLGVDSLRNVSGIQTGALDPAHGMFWTWNTGYIMAKLEGTSPHLTVPGHRFSYHIGGFAGKWNVLKTITINLPDMPDAVHTIDLYADVNSWFKGVTEFHLQNESFCHSPGPLAVQFANNYAGMFSLKSVE